MTDSGERVRTYRNKSESLNLQVDARGAMLFVLASDKENGKVPLLSGQTPAYICQTASNAETKIRLKNDLRNTEKFPN